MSFSFGFTNEDLSDDHSDICPPEKLSTEVKSGGKVLDEATSKLPKSLLPKVHSLKSIAASLVGVRLTYDSCSTPCRNNQVFRRSIFDVKYQIMSEDESGEDLTRDLLLAEKNEASDLKKNVYEGGFKSWECNYDVIDDLSDNYETYQEFRNILELGCGLALPSCYLLKRRLMSKATQPFVLILSDFNFEVLRLITVPNLIKHWAATLDPRHLTYLTTSTSKTADGYETGTPTLAQDELLLTELLVNEFLELLSVSNIEVELISGAWGKEFVNILAGFQIDFILSSETIYSIDTLPVVAEIIRELFYRSRASQKLAVVAAKNQYFGVGGSVYDFVSYLRRMKDSHLELSIREINEQNLKRSIIYIQEK